MCSYYKVGCSQGSLNAVECHKFLSLTCPSYDDLAALNLSGIEGVERLSYFHQDKIGHINYVVDWPESNGKKPFLKPLW